MDITPRLDPEDPLADLPVLGRDPFEAQEEFDPFAILTATAGTLRVAASGRDAPSVEGLEPDPVVPLSLHRRRRPAPLLADLDPVPPRGIVERWLGADERQRLASLQHLVDSELPYDRMGLSPDVLRRTFPIFYALYRLYFRVRSQGHEHLPTRGPAIVAANHGGLLPFDGAMLILDVLLHSDPPRLLRSIVDRWAGELPWVNIFYARVGQVIGTRENFDDLLSDDQMVLVFPEGVAGIRKTIAQRNRLQTFHMGFVEEALRHQTPIVPAAVIGSDDQTPILYDLPNLARRLGLPALPITPTFPWFGPLGLLPYPVRYRLVYGEPLAFHERFAPKDADDPRLVRYLARQVRHRIQRLVDRETSR